MPITTTQLPVKTSEELGSDIAQLIEDFEEATSRMVIGVLLKRSGGRAMHVEVLSFQGSKRPARGERK